MPKKKSKPSFLRRLGRELKQTGAGKEDRRRELLRWSITQLAKKENLSRKVKFIMLDLCSISTNDRVRAARALGYLEDKHAVRPLISALKDPQEEVRWTAAWALGELKGRRAVRPLISLLKDVDREVSWSAAEALGKFALGMVEGVGQKRLKVAEKKFTRLDGGKRGLLMYYLASNPVKLKKVPTDPKSKGPKMKFLIELREGLKGRSIAEIAKILDLVKKKKGKK